MISLAIEQVVTKGVKLDDANKMLYGFVEAASNIKREQVFDTTLSDFALIQNIYASFSHFEDYGLDTEDKSVNAHNCRKSCILSKLFLLHKLIAVAGAQDALNQEIRNLFIKYAKAYIELTSVISDL